MTAPKRLKLLLASLLCCSPGIALADNDTRLVDCSRGASIQEALGKKHPDRPLTVVIRGICTENVTVNRDDLTLVGETPLAVDRVNGTITLPGAKRVLIDNLTVSSPTGVGIEATDNAALRIQNSKLDGNGTDGIFVRRGAHATIRDSSLSNNGQAGGIDVGRGIHATHGGAVDVQNSTILNNRSDGVGVFNNSYARLFANTIEGNGRPEVGESGIQVNRSRVRANGNTIRNNTGISAVAVVNHSDYRTGTGLNATEFPNNEFPFEQIQHRVGPGLLAVDVNNASYGDFRQVDIVGAVAVGRQSMLQVRGDDVLPNQRCSTITLPAGANISISGRNGLLRLLFVNVTPPIFSIGGPNGQLDGSPVCVVAP